MFRTDVWALPPGITAAVETYEAAFRWGPAGLGLIIPGYINANTIDPGNTGTTFEIRPGLLLGQRTADGSWINYSPTNTDGSEVAAGVNITAIRMTDILTQQGVARFYGILVGGPVQASKIINLDLYARSCMSDHFWFDDNGNTPGNHWFPWKRFQSKSSNYQVLASDNFSVFDNVGASGTVAFTLPPIANGYSFGFNGRVAQNWSVSSYEGGNIVALGNASANTVTLQTASQQIGALIRFYTNPGASKWYLASDSSATLTLS